MLSIASALIHLHDQSIAHLDIKSLNVLIAGGGSVKLADVGLSRLVKNERTVLSGPNTYAWASPEQLENFAGTAADIWSFGTTLWEVRIRTHFVFVCQSQYNVEFQNAPAEDITQGCMLSCYLRIIRPDASPYTQVPSEDDLDEECEGAIAETQVQTTDRNSSAVSPGIVLRPN